MSLIASRLGPGVVALLVTAGLTLSSTPVEAAAARAAGKTMVRCTIRHHVRHCVRVVVRPVDHTSLFVPQVLAVEAYAIAVL